MIGERDGAGPRLSEARRQQIAALRSMRTGPTSVAELGLRFGRDPAYRTLDRLLQMGFAARTARGRYEITEAGRAALAAER
jgi:hypothetical protein